MFSVLKGQYKFIFRLIYIMLFLILGSSFSGIARQTYSEKNEGFKNIVYKENIKTILLYKVGFEMSEPVIQLNTSEKLLLSFDDLDDSKIKNFKYTIQHCDAYWRASDLIQSQYLEGYPEDFINDYEFSLNTTVPFIHYILEFPNDYLRPLISGNYIIKVYEENENDPVLIRRFKVIDPLLNILAVVRPSEQFSQRRHMQEIGFSIFKNNMYIQNPERDLIVIVQQNGRQDNLVTGLTPVRNLGDELDYNFNQKTIFKAGNEFRNFDTQSLKYRTERVKQIDYSEHIHHVYFREDHSRANDVYHFEHDINGQRIIRNTDGTNHNTEADYYWAHFFLSHQFLGEGANVYILGDLTDWQFNPENKLTYNFQKLGYEGKLLLKQGYYNYMYVVKYADKPKADLSVFEGDHFETTNDYTIYVYYLEPGTYYHQLIGYQKITAPN